MKKLIFVYLAMLFIIVNGCAEMSAAMSNVTANNCMYKSCVSSAYDESSGDYIEGSYITKTKDGRDVSYNEDIWVYNRQGYYNSFSNFGVWYERSPYSRVKYRFSTYCSQYYNNNYGW